MANTNPFTDGTVKPGDQLIYLPFPGLKIRFKFAGLGPEVVVTVDEESRHFVKSDDLIIHRRKLAFVPTQG